MVKSQIEMASYVCPFRECTTRTAEAYRLRAHIECEHGVVPPEYNWTGPWREVDGWRKATVEEKRVAKRKWDKKGANDSPPRKVIAGEKKHESKEGQQSEKGKAVPAGEWIGFASGATKKDGLDNKNRLSLTGKERR